MAESTRVRLRREPRITTSYHQARGTFAKIMAEGRVHRLVSLCGPAFVASVAYIDPGNFATNFEAGAQHRYLLVWEVVMANLIAILCEYLSATLGIPTGKSLSEVCHAEYWPGVNVFLWVQAELVAIATDLAEFVGAALGLNLVFGIPLLPAGLTTGAVSFLILLIEQKGYRPFQVVIVALLLCVAAGFIYDFIAFGHQSVIGILGGLIPRLEGNHSEALAVGIIGATVMPPVIYLHSALHAKRIRPENDGKLNCSTGTALHRRAGRRRDHQPDHALRCRGPVLPAGRGCVERFGFHLCVSGQHRGAGRSVGFRHSLIASVVASSTVGTYAGQVVMQGFMNWRIPLFWRRAITMIPSLIVLAAGANTTMVLIFSQVLLSFGTPFALIPLVQHIRKRALMGSLVNRRSTTWLAIVTAAVITALNLYLLWSTFQ